MNKSTTEIMMVKKVAELEAQLTSLKIDLRTEHRITESKSREITALKRELQLALEELKETKRELETEIYHSV